MAKYYQASGKFNPLAFLYFIGIALIALPLLGLIYAYAIWYIPFIYINFIIAAGFGFAIGWLMTNVVVKYGKIRNNALAIGLSVLAGCIALYFHWAVWADLVLNAGESYGNSRIGVTVSNIDFLQVFGLASEPGLLFDLIGEINEFGTWGIRSATVNGGVLTVIWIIEALIIIGIATVVPMGAAKRPFCELGDVWFEETVLPAFAYIEDRPQMLNDLENSNPESFKDLDYAKNLEDNHSAFTLFTSKHDENYLSISTNRAKTNDKGEIEFDSENFVEYIHLNAELKQVLLGK